MAKLKKKRMRNAELKRHLKSMGYWWFVSMLYHDRINNGETSWTAIKTKNLRGSHYDVLGDDDRIALIKMILRKKKSNFKPNTAGLPYDRIMEMAKELLIKLLK